MTSVKTLVITGFGINCQEETAAAFTLAGAEARVAHLNLLLRGEVRVHDFQVIAFPGGFSFGDDLTAGKALSNKIRYRRLPSGTSLLEDLADFVTSGGFIIGICNGFQALVKMGLLPNISGQYVQEVTLTHNDSARFEDRWVRCVANKTNRSPFLRGIEHLQLPVRHGEGKLLVRDPEVGRHILENGLVALRYCDALGAPATAYPENPNGSWKQCAALTDVTGRVLGIMPHPEAFLSLYNHPDWGARKRVCNDISEDGDGLAFFRNIVKELS